MGVIGSKPAPTRADRTDSKVNYKDKPNVAELGTNTSGIELSKSIIDFNLGERPCPLRTPVIDNFTITNTNPTRIHFQLDPSHPKEFQLTFSPSSGTIERGKTRTIKVKLVVTSKINVNHKATVLIDGAPHVLTARIRCETGVFGVDPSGIETEMDAGFQVPSILAMMKRSLLVHDGLRSEGIFRLAGEQTEIRRIKETMNRKEFTDSNDLNTIANLIKIWFRELPTPILNALPQESIFYSSEVSDCVAAFENLPEPQKSLLSWLMDLLIQVASHSTVNKMTIQNLAIVVAPNLYDVSTSNPMEGLVMSQKCVQFFHNVLLWKIQRDGLGGGAPAAPNGTITVSAPSADHPSVTSHSAPPPS
eukprot:TRINITY_DN447_c0_g1_i3.p1 TRINITY_DN447_c0_g1~~TRINITY_DN447_c0_g1_i3.p1  ORF type:complete len:362 (+),score=93.24 TRINITY_DN447_c0_g1_i3:204-1289(+)